MCLQSIRNEDEDIKYYAELLLTSPFGGGGGGGDPGLPEEETPPFGGIDEFLILPARDTLLAHQSDTPLERVWTNPLQDVAVFTFAHVTTALVALKDRLSQILSVDPVFYNPAGDCDFEIIQQWLSVQVGGNDGEGLVVNPSDVPYLISNLESGLYANYSLYIAFEKLIAATFSAAITSGKEIDACLNEEKTRWFDAEVEKIRVEAQLLWNLYDAVA